MSKHPGKQGWKRFFFGKLPLESETSLFILLSAGDVFMTYWLLREGNFIESNPVARYFLNHWGIKGMVMFKFAMVAFICLISQIIAMKKPDVARKLLVVATLVVGGVVVYSGMLYVRYGG